jgi:hypothetical protein
MRGIDYFEYPETELVLANLATGSMAASHLPKLVMFHAVARKDDGALNDRTECGIRVYFGPDQAEPRPWEQTNALKRCQVCVDTAGGALINGVTGERWMP